ATARLASAAVVPAAGPALGSARGPDAGAVRVRIGGVVSRLTERVTWAVFPATSRATTVIVFGPSPRRIVRLKAPVVGFTPVVAPFTVTVAPTSVVPETLVVAIRVRA